MGLRRSIISLKSKPHLPGIVVRAIDERFASLPELGPDLIVPVPLSKQRRFERGFNQAEVIADVVARSTGIPVDRMSLQRKEHTKMHRAGMDRKAREGTVENAFAVARPKMIVGKNILLTDDVFTSGATVSACAGILKANGAQTVNVFTIARAEFRR
jgi:Predicted amidophosphoribosyltransferases